MSAATESVFAWRLADEPAHARSVLSVPTAVVADHDDRLRKKCADTLTATGWFVVEARDAVELADALLLEVLEGTSAWAWDMVLARIDLAGGGAEPVLSALRRHTLDGAIVLYGGDDADESRRIAARLGAEVHPGEPTLSRLRALLGCPDVVPFARAR